MSGREQAVLIKASSAGISGLMRKQERERRETGKLADEAFSDLKALMNKTRDVVSRDCLHLLRRPRHRTATLLPNN